LKKIFVHIHMASRSHNYVFLLTPILTPINSGLAKILFRTFRQKTNVVNIFVWGGRSLKGH
jgi:hypothetical protein